jgi:hypothetical protein
MRHDLDGILHGLCPGGIVASSLKVSVLPMECRASDTVSASVNGTHVFLAGDAAMGLPLEKGLNFGWRIASRLSRYISFCQTPELAAAAYASFFAVVSNEAVSSVNSSYEKYLSDDVNKATLLRSVLKPFAGRARVG